METAILLYLFGAIIVGIACDMSRDAKTQKLWLNVLAVLIWPLIISAMIAHCMDAAAEKDKQKGDYDV